MKTLLSFGTLGLAIIAIGCTDRPATTAAGSKTPDPLRIAAASDLQTVLPKVIALYEKEATGAKVVTTFGASGILAEQVRAGAPFDLFLAANTKFVTDLSDSGVIEPGSVRPYAIGSLVLAVHLDAAYDLKIATLNDLAKPGVKSIALANPATAPYGKAGKQALVKAGLWEKVESRIVYSETVRQALQFVQTGNAEAGLVSKATADVREVTAIEVDPALYDPIVQSLGVVKRAARPDDAARFVRFLTNGPGRALLDEHGFKRPIGVSSR